MKFFVTVLILCSVNLLENFVNGGVVPEELFRLDIVHYNDFHDRFEETSVAYPVCTTNDTKCLGGFPRLYQEIQTLLKEKPGALLLNAGDVFQGTYWYTLLKWNITQKFINMLPNDAHAIGNHEFDDGPPGLAPYLAGLRAPVVAANIDTSQEPSLNGFFKPHIIVERNGRKIGIIGIITTDTEISSNPRNVKFTDPIEAVQKEAQQLTEQGVDIIIVLSHCGLEVDKKIANKVGDNIDIIVGGHSHSLLWNGTSPSNEEISGPYPVLVEAEDKPEHRVLIVTASAFTKYLGNLTTYFDKTGELQSFDGEPIFLNRSIPEDPEIKKLLEPYTEKLHTLVNEVVGFANDDLLAGPCGSQECAIGDLAADSFINTIKELNVSNLPPVSLLLRNSIRGSIPKGNITRGEIINTMPFSNRVVTMALKGKYIVEALDKFLINYWTLKPFNSPWMPQVGGLRITVNTTTQKTTEVLVKEGVEFKPIDPEQEVQLVVLKFMLKDGGAFDMLNNGRNVTLVGKDTEIFEEYVNKISPITPTLDNRLTVVV